MTYSIQAKPLSRYSDTPTILIHYGVALPRVGRIVAYSRQGVIPKFGGLGGVLQVLTEKKKERSVLRIVTQDLGLLGFCEYGNELCGSIEGGEFL